MPQWTLANLNWSGLSKLVSFGHAHVMDIWPAPNEPSHLSLQHQPHHPSIPPGPIVCRRAVCCLRDKYCRDKGAGSRCKARRRRQSKQEVSLTSGTQQAPPGEWGAQLRGCALLLYQPQFTWDGAGTWQAARRIDVNETCKPYLSVLAS